MKRTDYYYLAFAILVGSAFSLLPYLVSWPWFADFDEMVAIALSASSYHNHLFFLGDAVQPEITPSLYPWLQIIPATIATKVLGLAPHGVGFLWRLFAGLSIPIAWFLVFRYLTGDSRWALVGSLFCMADSGYHGSVPLFRHMYFVSEILAGRASHRFESFPQYYIQWRLITPALSLAALLFHAHFVNKTLAEPTKRSVVLSGVSLALLIYSYFYFWTSAVVALGFGFLFQKERRKTILLILGGGLLLGSPSLIYGFAIKNTYPLDYLHRNDLFLPIDRLSEILFPRKAFLLGFLAVMATFLFREKYSYFALLFLAASIMLNHQIVTGLQLQNFHYLYVIEPLLMAAFVLFIFEISLKTKRELLALKLAACVLALLIPSGLFLRYLEARDTHESQIVTQDYRRIDFINHSIFTPQSVISGDDRFLVHITIASNLLPLTGYNVLMSAPVTNKEWHQRHALNWYLLGESQRTYRENEPVRVKGFAWGPWARDLHGHEKLLNERLDAFDEVSGDPDRFIRKFNVKYLAMPYENNINAFLTTRTRKLISNNHWTILEFADGSQ